MYMYTAAAWRRLCFTQNNSQMTNMHLRQKSHDSIPQCFLSSVGEDDFEGTYVSINKMNNQFINIIQNRFIDYGAHAHFEQQVPGSIPK